MIDKSPKVKMHTYPTNTHIARDKAGSFDEGAADVKEVSSLGARQVTEGYTDKQSGQSGDRQAFNSQFDTKNKEHRALML